jgi:hypothetical protein
MSIANLNFPVSDVDELTIIAPFLLLRAGVAVGQHRLLRPKAVPMGNLN